MATGCTAGKSVSVARAGENARKNGRTKKVEEAGDHGSIGHPVAVGEEKAESMDEKEAEAFEAESSHRYRRTSNERLSQQAREEVRCYAMLGACTWTPVFRRGDIP